MVKHLLLISIPLLLMLTQSCRHLSSKSAEKNSLVALVEENGEVSSSDIESYVSDMTTDDLLGQMVQKVYADRGYEPIWSDGQTGTPVLLQFQNVLNRASRWGIDPTKYYALIRHSINGNKGQVAVLNEMAYTEAALVLLAHVSLGTVRTNAIFSETEHAFFRQQTVDAFARIVDGAEFKTVLDSVQPQFAQYKRLKSAASNLEFPAYQIKSFPFVKTNECDSVVWTWFRMLGYDISGLPQTDTLKSRLLASYQKTNGLAVSGRFDFDTYCRFINDQHAWFDLVELNMERLRQNPPLLKTYVWVNIPSFKLELVQNETVCFVTRVVVGAPDTPTPTVSGKISHVITFPAWNIPNSIIHKEIIPAMRRDSSYLAKKGYKVSTWAGKAMPYTSVLQKYGNSENLPFNVSQPPGVDNALGVLKFLFNNSESVYLHDTNAKSYFGRQYRALSHGCVRVQEPHKLAELLLDSASIVRMDKQLANHVSGHLPLTKEVGVYLRYLTCDMQTNGKFLKLNDIYRQDFVDRHRMEKGFESITGSQN